MTPALGCAPVLATPVTRASMVPSPVKSLLAKLNWSNVPQMSAPAPFTAHMPVFVFIAALPGTPGEPTSWSLHSGGKPAVDPGTVSKVIQFRLKPGETTTTLNEVNSALVIVPAGMVVHACQPPVAGTVMVPVTLLPPTSR